MAKFRTRVKGGTKKATKWSKGHSSDSNPSIHKYRQNAKSRFFQPLPTTSSKDSALTTEAVALLDRVSGLSMNDDDDVIRNVDDDQLSYGGTTSSFKTFDTFASDFSDCSNRSYSKLVDKFRSDSAIHKDMLAVLAAVTEVIKQNGGSQSSTEYFASLLTALSTNEYNDDQTSAIVNLLAMGIKSVPRPVLQSKFAESSTILLKLLERYSSGDRVSLVRSILGCLSVLLRAQDASIWNDSSTIRVLKAILAYVTFSKPKIRKSAQHSVAAIVAKSEVTNVGLSTIAAHCTDIVENASTTGGVTTILHILTLLKDVLHSFPRKQLKKCCEGILKIMTLNNVLITSCSFQTLDGLFANASPDQLPSQLAAKFINALYDYQPPPSDSQPIQAWIALMQRAHSNLAKSDVRLCALNLPKFYSTLTSFYLTARLDTTTALTLILQNVTADCLRPLANSPQSVSLTGQIVEIVDIHRSLLSYQYANHLHLVLHLIAALFKSLDSPRYHPYLLPLITTLAEFRESNSTSYPNEIDSAIGSAIKHLGPQIVVDVLPLMVDDFKRSWILPLLKENVVNSTLKCFVDNFLPFTTKCRIEADKCRTTAKGKALSYDLLETQIWSLLPSFANRPKDVASTFPNIAKALGGLLTNRTDLRLVVMSTLRLLVGQAVDDKKDEDVVVLTRYAKNYLPILFNVYTTQVKGSDEEGVRLASLETIKIYLRITPEQLCVDLFGRAVDKLKSDDVDKFMKDCSLDLTKALIPYQPSENVRAVYDIVKTNVGVGSSQKKYYKCLEGILTSESDCCRQFVVDNFDDVKNLILNSFKKAAPNSKGARLRCVVELLNKSDCDSTFVESVLPEAVMSLKDVNGKTRQIAHKILALIFDKETNVDDLITNLSAGLLGTSNLVSCTILSLSSLIYYCKEKLSSNIEKRLLHNVGLLALSPTREIVSAAMTFIKVYVTSHPRDKVVQFVPRIVAIFSAMDEHCKPYNRNRTRDILAKLIRWFGVETVASSIPPSDELLALRVKNLGKLHSRKQRKRASERGSQATGCTAETTFSVANRNKTIDEILAECDDELDVEDETEEETKKTKKKKKSKTWIMESGEDIVDFTDSRLATRNITGTKPQIQGEATQMKNKFNKSKFPSAPDGRLIILNDDDNSDDDKKIKKSKNILPGIDIPNQDFDSDDNSDFDEISTVADSTITHRKRALSVSSAGSGFGGKKYRAGGSGIHRVVKKGSHQYGKTGEEYRSTKGRGDVKQKGKPDPFAYLPLRRDALNKRKRAKAAGALKNVLNAAKRGAASGSNKKIKLKRLKK